MPEGTPAQQRRQQRSCHPRYRQRVEKLAEVLQQAIASGELRELDTERLALFIIEGSTAVLLERLSEKSSPAESADVDLLVGLILDGIRKRS
jgi:ribosomal protein L22